MTNSLACCKWQIKKVGVLQPKILDATNCVGVLSGKNFRRIFIDYDWNVKIVKNLHIPNH